MISIKLPCLLLCSIATIAQNCQNAYLIEYSSCVFYFNQSASCSFASCSWQLCNDFYCSTALTYTSKNWTACTQTCCNSSAQYAENTDSIQQCQEFTNQQHKQTYLIVGIVFGIVGLLIVLFMCFYCCCNVGSLENCMKVTNACVCYLLSCNCFRNSSEIENNQANYPPSLASQQNLYVNSFNLASQSLIKIWENVENKKDRIYHNCSVCYQDRPTVELECGHIFHISCIFEWTRRKINCPQCRSSQIQNIRIYCSECLKSYFQTKLRQIGQQKIQVQELCDQCKVQRQI